VRAALVKIEQPSDGFTPVEGCVGGCQGEEASVQGLLRQRVVGWVIVAGHDFHWDSSCQLTQAHVYLSAHITALFQLLPDCTMPAPLA